MKAMCLAIAPLLQFPGREQVPFVAAPRLGADSAGVLGWAGFDAARYPPVS